MRSAYYSCVALVVAIVEVSAARAQEDAATQYLTLVAEAVAEFDAGRWAEARALFMRAHELSPNARTHRGMGMASFEQRDYVEAVRALRAALASQEMPLTPELRVQAEALLGRALRFIGQYRVTLSPETATLAVDGAAAGQVASRELLFAIGTHTLVASAEGHAPVTRDLQVAGGEQRTIDFLLEPLPGRVAITSHPPTAEIRVDGVIARPAEGGVLVLPAGRHELRATAAGYAPIGRMVTIAPGESTSLVLVLSSAAERASGLLAVGHAPTGNSNGLAMGLLVTTGVLAAGAIGAALYWKDRQGQISRCELAPCTNYDSITTERNAGFALMIGLGIGAAISGGIGLMLLGGFGDSVSHTTSARFWHQSEI